MTRKQLAEAIFSRQSYLCVGLDTDPSRIPAHLMTMEDPIFEFNKQIIDATKDLCVSYKINTAFYEAQGLKGWAALEKTVAYIPSSHFKIADAKRGDIGNTSSQYAKAFFETMPFDSITVAPYMGEDSVKPFLAYKDKWAIILGLTSNQGARDFEMKRLISHKETLDEGIHITRNETSYLYETVLSTSSLWGTDQNTMYVIGATQAEEFDAVRKLIPNHFLLVPGVGAQGGSLHDISEKAMIADCGLLVNASRAIIYASSTENFAEEARKVAQTYQQEMSKYLNHL